jgi:hypothetical protein
MIFPKPNSQLFYVMKIADERIRLGDSGKRSDSTNQKDNSKSQVTTPVPYLMQTE